MAEITNDKTGLDNLSVQLINLVTAARSLSSQPEELMNTFESVINSHNHCAPYQFFKERHQEQSDHTVLDILLGVLLMSSYFKKLLTQCRGKLTDSIKTYLKSEVGVILSENMVFFLPNDLDVVAYETNVKIIVTMISKWYTHAVKECGGHFDIPAAPNWNYALGL